CSLGRRPATQPPSGRAMTERARTPQRGNAMKTILISAAAAAFALSFAGVRAVQFTGVAEAETARAVPAAPAPQIVTPATPMGCADAVLCVGDCRPGDAACKAECERDVTKPAERLYHALMSCAELHECNGDGLCARQHCAAELNSCLGADAPEGG